MCKSKIIIHEGFLASDNTNIVPARKSKTSAQYEINEAEMISISCYYLEGYLETLLKKHFSSDVQLEKYNDMNEYNEYGWNFYTSEQINCVLAELERYIAGKDSSDETIDFYARYISRMKRMLQNMGGYDLILFEGP